MRRWSWIVAGSALMLMAGCGGFNPDDGEDRNPYGVAEVDNSVVVESQPAVARQVVTRAGPECDRGPGKTVTKLDDVIVPAIEEPGYRVDDVDMNGLVIPGFVVTPVSIPEQVVEGGCIIEYDAPDDCLGAVEITGIEVPGYTIPGFEIPAVEAGFTDGYPGTVVEDVVVEDIPVDGVRVEQQCTRPGTTSVYRPQVYRESVFHDSAYRSRLAAHRRPLCSRDKELVWPPECTEPVGVPGLHVPALEVPAVTVEATERPASGG
jgi:hypothetical protein